jgi:hypothetical protein
MIVVNLHNVQDVRILGLVSMNPLNASQIMFRLTQRMAAAQLRLLRISALQLIANAVQQLNITLLRLLLEGVDEGP